MGVQFYVPVTTDVLAVNGQSTLADTLVSTLDVSGNSTLAGTSVTVLTISEGLTVSGGLDVAGVPGVSGETILHGDLVVNGSIVMDGTVDMDQYLTVGGLLSANGSLVVAGTSTLDAFTVHNDGSIGGNFAVIGESILNQVTVGSTLVVSGNTAVNSLTIVSGGLDVAGVPGVSGETILRGDLVVNGSVVMDGTVDMDRYLTVGGLLTANGNLKVNGAATMYSFTATNNGSIGGNFVVNGESTLNQVTVNTLTASNLVSFSGGFAVTDCMPTVPAPLPTSDGLQIATTAWVKDIIQTLIGVDTNAAISLQALSNNLASDLTDTSGIAALIITEANRAQTAADNAETSYNNATTKANNASLSAAAAAQSAADALATLAGFVGSDDDSAYATIASPTFTGNVTVSTGDIVLNSTSVGSGRIQFAARDSAGTVPYFMGVDANSPDDELVIKKGTETLMSISNAGFSGSNSAQTVTFSAPVVMTDIFDLTSATCKIKVSGTQYITGADFASFLLSGSITKHTF